MAKILVAEDDDAMRAFLEKALNQAGHDVRMCEDGLEALDALQSEGDYDLLLADIVIPGLDGIELSQKAIALYPQLKIMFITGFSAMALGDRYPEDGQATVMSKPFHLKELVAQVEDVLGA